MAADGVDPRLMVAPIAILAMGGMFLVPSHLGIATSFWSDISTSSFAGCVPQMLDDRYRGLELAKMCGFGIHDCPSDRYDGTWQKLIPLSALSRQFDSKSEGYSWAGPQILANVSSTAPRAIGSR